MKTTAILFSLFITFSASAQFDIPNGDFEDWEFNGWLYSPVDWQTNNTQVTQDVFQDSAAFEGVLAMRVEATIVELGSYGEASIEIPTEAIPPSLDFYAKWHRTYTASVGVEISFYNEDLVVYQQFWSPADTASGWVAINMPLDQIEPVMTHVVIKVSAFVGDFAPGEGWISVDAMTVGGPNAVEERHFSTISIYPNPADESINVQVDDELSPKTMVIYDALGKEVVRRPYSKQIGVTDLIDGCYVLTLLDEERLIVSETFYVIRD